MSDSRQSPIPQDRVNENLDERGRADAAKQQQRQLERERPDAGVRDRAGENPAEQPGIPAQSDGPAEGGD